MTFADPAGRQNSQAILFMIATVFFFSMMDASIKALAPKVGVLMGLWARYTWQMIVVFVLVLPRLRPVMQTKYPKIHVLRSLMLMLASGFFFVGLSRIPLSDAAALMSTNPMFITLGAALFLGEALGLRRIIGICVAMIGALIVMRPGTDVFQPAAIFPILAALCYSTYALLTRRVGPEEDIWTSLFYTGLVGTVVLTCGLPFFWQTPDATGLILMAMVAGFGTLGQLCLIRAFTAGEAAMLAPYAYSGLIFAAVWGMLFFGEWPDIWTICGALVIALAGLYVWQRETFRN